MAEWMDLYGVNELPSLGQQLARNDAMHRERVAAIDAFMQRRAQMEALNSPFIRQLMQNLIAEPAMNQQPSFGPMTQPSLSEADLITPNYPSKMGVNLPPGAIPGAGMMGIPPNSQPGVRPPPVTSGVMGGAPPPSDEPKLEFTIGELERVPRGPPEPPPGSTKDAAGRPVIHISGANWVDDAPKPPPPPERQLMGGSIGQRPLNLRQGIRSTEELQARAAAAARAGTITPEQFAIFQQLLPQLTQRRITQEQSRSAEDRKYAELDLRQRTSQMQNGYNIWKTSVDTATKLRLAEEKLRAAAAKNGQNRMLRDLVPALSNLRTRVEGENNRIAIMLQNGFASSVNPEERMALQMAYRRATELQQAADAITMQYTGLFNEQYGQQVPTLKPTTPIPTAPPGQGKAPAQPAQGPLTPKAQQFMLQFKS